MADFDITRAEATVPVGLPGFVYHEAIAAWKHDSGAWICIECVRSQPHVYIVLWRAVPFWGGREIANVGAFEEHNPDLAWTRALGIARVAFERGPRGEVLAKAVETQAAFHAGQSERGTRGGQKSGKVRQEMSEARKEAEELGRRFKILFVPQFDPRVWIFSPIRDVKDRPVIQFAWKKQKTTFAYMSLTDDGQSWDVGREWHPGMNDDNAPITEVCARGIGDSLHKDDPAVLMLERLLKTDPEKWLKGDYVRFQ